MRREEIEDDFEDGDPGPWVVVHGDTNEDGGGMQGSNFTTHVSPSMVVDTGMPPGSKVFVRANITAFDGGAGFTMRRNGSNFCGFFVWSETTLYIAAHNPIEQSQGSIASFSYGVQFLLEAELDGNQLKVWLNGSQILDMNQSECAFEGSGEVGTLHHSGAQSLFHDFYAEWE